MQDTVAGRTNFYIGSAAAADALVKADRLRLFGVTSRNRFLGLEDIPAIAETLPGYRIEGWFAFVAPAGTPAEIVDRMKREINLSLQNPEMVQKLKGYGCAISRLYDRQEVSEFLSDERQNWKQIADEIGLVPQ